MNCRRCHGFMVEERFEDLRGDPHDISFYGWRCVCCGDIVDPVIIRNRLIGPTAAVARLAIHRLVYEQIAELNLEQPAA